MIRQITTPAELRTAAGVIRESFQTVADGLNLTSDNCPSHPAFITDEQVQVLMVEGLAYHALYHDGTMAGVVGIKPLNDDDYAVEKLAVLPRKRHLGFGRALMVFSFGRIYRLGGRRICIAIVDENVVLKQWYTGLGFVTTETMRFPHLPFTVCYMQKDLSCSCLTRLL